MVLVGGGLHLVRPSLARDGGIRDVSPEEKRRDQERLIQGWLTSQKQRNFSPATVASAQRGLANFLAAAGKFCWEITVNDVRDYHDTLCELGLEVTTRRGYLTHIKQFFAFNEAHPKIPLTTLEIQAGLPVERVDHKYAVRLQQPVDRWYMPVHVTDDVVCKRTTRALPTKDELRGFFAFLRGQIDESHKGVPVARDYAMFRFLYHTGMRENEVAMVDVKDVRFELGTIHCRIGKGSGGSGPPRERWIPMLYGLDQVLRIYLAEVRPKFMGADRTKALFLAEAGGPITNRTIRAGFGSISSSPRSPAWMSPCSRAMTSAGHSPRTFTRSTRRRSRCSGLCWGISFWPLRSVICVQAASLSSSRWKSSRRSGWTT